MDLVSVLWPGLAASFVLGCLIGALMGLPRDRSAVLGASALGLTLVALCGLAVAGVVPEEAGLWVETAASLLGAYLAGCGLGSVGSRLFRRVA